MAACAPLDVRFEGEQGTPRPEDSAPPIEDSGEGCETLWYLDLDDDGYGDDGRTYQSCEAPAAFVDRGGDCDDGDPHSHPAADERCDGRDNDCDGDIDEDALDAPGWHPDADGDGWGDANSSVAACERPEGLLAEASDCDDTDDEIHPEALEICGDGLDNDCEWGDRACGIPAGVTSLRLADAKLYGEEEGGYAGSVAMGDVLGDGLADVIVGAPGTFVEGDDLGDATGVVYVVATPIHGDRSLSQSSAQLYGEEEYGSAGASVASGDVDGDGFSDLVVGTPEYDHNGTNRGASYIVVGPLSGDIALSSADGRIYGEDYEGVGETLSFVGDVRGMGTGCLLVGTTYGDGYLLSQLPTAQLTTDAADARFYGSNFVGGGGGGDVDGDGMDDLLLGAQVSGEIGPAYLFSGPISSGEYALGSADAVFKHEEEDDYWCGAAVALAGDVNADGFGDVLIGANRESSAAEEAGAAYLVLGPVSGSQDLAWADAKLLGESEDNQAGCSVAAAGDLQGDGFDDILVGACREPSSTRNGGAAYVLLGPVSGQVDLSSADSKLRGENDGDYAGSSLAGAADCNGDGFPDILLGAFGAGGERDLGAAYLLYGGRQ